MPKSAVYCPAGKTNIPAKNRQNRLGFVQGGVVRLMVAGILLLSGSFFQGELLNPVVFMSEKIAVIGLGYVGLPVALALAEKFDDVIGFDVNAKRVSALSEGHDETSNVTSEELAKSKIKFSHKQSTLR